MFYVYDLIDPRDGAVFYVGKGCRGRITRHEAYAKRGALGRKCDRIRAIWKDGGEVQRRYVRHFTDEAEAYRFEAEHIAAIGLGKLTNAVRGGAGKARPFRWSPRLARQHAVTIATLRRILVAGQRLWLGPYEITDICLGVLARIDADLVAG